MTEDDKQRVILCGIIEGVMRFARNDRDLLQWGKDHAELIRQELTETEQKHLREVYKELMAKFLEKDAA